MNKCATGFFAYPAKPLSLAETIESAIKQINKNGAGTVSVQGWKSLDVPGRLVVHEVCAAINSCDLFICDLTELSMNVFFELGYAIAKNKRVWITLDASYQHAKDNYTKLSILSTVGYAPYQNSYELTDQFLSEQPFLSESTIFQDVIQSIVQAQTAQPSLLYLKCELKTEASVRLTRRLQKSGILLVTDDPEEISNLPLTWYALKTFYACGVIAHLIDEKRVRNSVPLRNAKYSLVSGLAYGFDRPLLLLAHAPFSSPVDYRDLLHVHETSAECLNAVNAWLPAIAQDYSRQREEHRKRQATIGATVELHRIDLGGYIAENEEHELSKYFVPTDAFREALNTSLYRLYVGRKGSGKTANLYQIARNLLEDKRNHVCIIRPIDYELEGVLSLLTSNLSKADPGYLTESLWKFLIYTELAVSVYDQLKEKPIHSTLDKEQTEFMEYIQSHRVIFSEFTVRMEHAIKELCQIGDYDNVREQRAKVSEILHKKLLGDLRRLLGGVLREKHKVFVLVDNLDKAWRKREDLDVLSAFLFGLLSAGQTISNEFQKDRLKWPGVNLALIVFLRSDIFSHIKRVARERDKISFTQMDWNDPVLLQRVIEERIASSLGEEAAPGEIWRRFFADEVQGVLPEEYIVRRIVPHPRDIIYFCSNALSQAINHRNTRIEESDILSAERSYSRFAFDTLRTETETQLEEIETLLYEFVGADEIVTREQIEGFMQKANIPEDKIDYVIDLLYESVFLGLETAPNTFEFLYEPDRKQVLQKLSQQTAELRGEGRFKINIPFHSFLEIRPQSEEPSALYPNK